MLHDADGDSEMPTHILKGVLGFVLAGLIAVGCAFAWNRSNPARLVDQALPGSIVAFSDTMAGKTTFWFDFELENPEDPDNTGNVVFSYRLEDIPEQETTVSFALSGFYADMLTTCSAQSIQIERELSFDELPMGGRLALLALERSTQEGNSRKSRVPLGEDEVSSTATIGQLYTTITIPIKPERGGVEADTEIVGAQSGHRCSADLVDMWYPVPGGYRVLTPAMAASAPDTTPSSTAISPGTKVETDDRFFLQRSTHEFDQSGTSTSTTVDTYTITNSEGFETAVSDPGGATYSSAALQERERNQTLSIGVLLGVAASIFISVLSGSFDLVVEWFKAKRRRQVDKR